jgi:hypothetical protein
MGLNIRRLKEIQSLNESLFIVNFKKAFHFGPAISEKLLPSTSKIIEITTD